MLLEPATGIAAQLDLMNAPDLSREAARGLLDLLGACRVGTTLESDAGLREASREDLLHFALDHATAYLLGFCSVRCWGQSRHAPTIDEKQRSR